MSYVACSQCILRKCFYKNYIHTYVGSYSLYINIIVTWYEETGLIEQIIIPLKYQSILDMPLSNKIMSYNNKYSSRIYIGVQFVKTPVNRCLISKTPRILQ